MNTRVVKVGIMSPAEMREYTMKIARGEIKPDPDASKIFFPTLRAFAEALNGENKMLLDAINTHRPESIAALAEIVQRDAGNVSRALKRLEERGLVRFENGASATQKKPVVLYDKLVMEMPLAC